MYTLLMQVQGGSASKTHLTCDQTPDTRRVSDGRDVG